MKRIMFVFVITLLVFLLPSFTSPGGLTSLSKKAAFLMLGMHHEAVINLLGQATWAVIPGDKGELALPDPRIRLELYWKNPGCAPVVVQFNHDFKVIGWDEGRAYCGKDAHLLEPSGEYSCNKPDRAKFCK